MSCVAEANAVMMNSTRVMVNILIGVVPAAMVASSGRGMVRVSKIKAIDISICMETTHHLLVLMMSTNGLQKGLIVQGRYSKLVNSAMSPLGTPILANISTEMLFTIK